MQKPLYLTALMLLFGIHTSYANDELKLKTVQHLYANAIAIKDYQLQPKHATPDFAKAIKRTKKVTEQSIADGTGVSCYESEPFLFFSDWDLADTKKSYKINKQGQVVVKIDFGDKSFHGQEEYRFTLQCNNNRCLVDEIVAKKDYPYHIPIHYKQQAKKHCPK